jgi:hypothetical protein
MYGHVQLHGMGQGSPGTAVVMEQPRRAGVDREQEMGALGLARCTRSARDTRAPVSLVEAPPCQGRVHSLFYRDMMV